MCEDQQFKYLVLIILYLEKCNKHDKGKVGNGEALISLFMFLILKIHR